MLEKEELLNRAMQDGWYAFELRTEEDDVFYDYQHEENFTTLVRWQNLRGDGELQWVTAKDGWMSPVLERELRKRYDPGYNRHG